MLLIKYLDNNKIAVSLDTNSQKERNYYLNTMMFTLKYSKIDNKSFIFNYKDIDLLKKYFKEIKFINEYTPPIYNDMGKDMKLQPYDYQKECIWFIKNHLNSLLIAPCGSGKSCIMIGAYLEAINNNIIKGQGLIIVKASLKIQWQKEVSKFSDLTANVLKTYSDRCSKFKNKISKASEQEKEDLIKEADDYFDEQFNNADLLIANYETLLDDNVLNKLLNKNIEFIACDEIQYSKSHTAKRSKALYKLNKAKVKVGATATPITKDPRDIYGIFKFINPDLFGSYSSFSKQYIKFAGYGRINGFKNLDILKNNIKNNLLVKTKEEVSSQLPKLNCIKKYCDLTVNQIDMQEKILNELKELNDEDYAIRIKCKSEAEALTNEKLQQINGKVMALQAFAQELADTPKLLELSESDMAKKYIADINESPKLDLCLELIEEILDSGEKVVIFSRFERMQSILTEAINKRFKDIKISYINGSLSAEQRYIEAYDKFKDNKDYKILLCSDAGAEGLNLETAKYLIEYDLASSYAIQTQRQGRIQRASSSFSNITCYQLIANNSWDEIALKIIKKKEDFDTNIIKDLI